jgi:hypothetical protein
MSRESLDAGFFASPDSMETPQRRDNRRDELRRAFSAVILPLAVCYSGLAFVPFLLS